MNVSDPDGNLREIIVSQGSFANGVVCLSPTVGGRVTVITRAVDSCGAQAADTTIVDITLNTPPKVVFDPKPKPRL